MAMKPIIKAKAMTETRTVAVMAFNRSIFLDRLANNCRSEMQVLVQSLLQLRATFSRFYSYFYKFTVRLSELDLVRQRVVEYERAACSRYDGVVVCV